MRLTVKVVPKSSRDRIAGWLGETLKVCVTSPPDKGRANSAVQALLGEILGCSVGDLRLVSGKTSSRKIIEIEKMGSEEVLARLNAHMRQNERKGGASLRE